MLERFVGLNCDAEEAIKLARTFNNTQLDRIADSLNSALSKEKVYPIKVTAKEKEEVMSDISRAIGGITVGEDELTGSCGIGINMDIQKLRYTKYYKIVAEELYQTQ